MHVSLFFFPVNTYVLRLSHAVGVRVVREHSQTKSPIVQVQLQVRGPFPTVMFFWLHHSRPGRSGSDVSSSLSYSGTQGWAIHTHVRIAQIPTLARER